MGLADAWFSEPEPERNPDAERMLNLANDLAVCDRRARDIQARKAKIQEDLLPLIPQHGAKGKRVYLEDGTIVELVKSSGAAKVTRAFLAEELGAAEATRLYSAAPKGEGKD